MGISLKKYIFGSRNTTIIAPVFSPEYQVVLDYADAQGYTKPSLKYNLIIDRIVSKLLADGNWAKSDFLYYFKHDGSREFATLNYKDPTKHRLIDVGVNPVTFTPEVGFEVSGGNGQCFSTQYTPSTDAVNVSVLSSGLFYRMTQTPTSNAGIGRIISGYGSNVALGVNVINQNNSMLGRVFENGQGNFGINQAEVNRHYLINDFGTTKRLYKDSHTTFLLSSSNIDSALTPVPLYLFGLNNNGSVLPTEGKMGLEYIGFGSDFEAQVENLFDSFDNYFEKAAAGTSVLTSTQTQTNTIFFCQVEKASKFPTLNTAKDYIFLWGTNHIGDGKSCWGEMDDLNFTNFIYRGIIVSGYSAESPNVMLMPNDPDGQTIHFSYHPNNTHPDSGGYQQTRLLTRIGGDLHDSAGWTDRGKVLGLTAEELNYTSPHTGYLIKILQPDNSFVGIHSTGGGNLPKMGKSTSMDGRTWTRVTSDLDVSSFMPTYRQFHHAPFTYFTRNGFQYCVGRIATVGFDTTKSKIGIAQCDNNDYLPTKYLGSISGTDSGNANTNAFYYIDDTTPDILHIFYIVADITVKRTTFNLTKLD